MEPVKGFRDVSGEEALKREKIKEILIKNFKSYGFELAETPAVEYEEFVKGENPQDEAISDIFRLQDRGQRKLALRYEFTFQLKRLAKGKRLPYKRYQIGEVFRDEPVSSNRFRQFTQCDVDIVGSTARDEAEVLALFSRILKELRIDAVIYINSRKLLNEILDEQKIKQKAEVLREIDKLDKLPEVEVRENLKKYNAQDLLDIFEKPEQYFKRYKAYQEIKELKKYCAFYNLKINFLPSLARGLSYYNGSVFEIKTKKMRESIAGGGAYLVNDIQSAGISFGLERLSQLARISLEEKKLLIISIAQEREAILLAEKLRAEGLSAILFDKISKGLEYANAQKIPFVVFVGKEELRKKKFKLRDMKTGKEKMLTSPQIIKTLT